MATQVQQIEEITPAEAALEIDDGDVALIDTREPHEYQEAHLENGKLVPLTGGIVSLATAAAPTPSTGGQ